VIRNNVVYFVRNCSCTVHESRTTDLQKNPAYIRVFCYVSFTLLRYKAKNLYMVSPITGHDQGHVVIRM